MRLKELVNGFARGTTEFEELIDALMPLLHGTEELPTDTALDLSTALIELESETLQDDQLFALVNAHGAAAVALAQSGQILAVNAAAAALFRLSTGDGLSALGISRTEFERFTQRLAMTPGTTLIRGYRTDKARQKEPILLSGTYSPGYRAFVLKALQNYWPDSVDHALAELFELSHSEREILSGLARGMTSDQIAEERKRTVGTVRQQVKSILHKLEAARRSPWMARLMTRPALRSGIIGTYSFYLNQMGAGFEHDLQMMLTDWSHLVAALEVPTVLLHGSRNPTTPPAYPEIFRKLNRGLRIELVEDAGLTVAVSHPHRVYEEITRLLSPL